MSCVECDVQLVRTHVLAFNAWIEGTAPTIWPKVKVPESRPQNANRYLGHVLANTTRNHFRHYEALTCQHFHKYTVSLTWTSYSPQWQKSDEMTKRFSGSARYLLKSRPYIFSPFSNNEPTKIGTMVNWPCLLKFTGGKTETNLQYIWIS